MRKSDVDLVALEELVGRIFFPSGRCTIERTEAGVSTQVYRICRGDEVFYLRVAEERNGGKDELRLGRAGDRGVGVEDAADQRRAAALASDDEDGRGGRPLPSVSGVGHGAQPGGPRVPPCSGVKVDPSDGMMNWSRLAR